MVRKDHLSASQRWVPSREQSCGLVENPRDGRWLEGIAERGRAEERGALDAGHTKSCFPILHSRQTLPIDSTFTLLLGFLNFLI